MVDSGMSQEEIYQEQEQEIESLKYIYMDDFELLEERPFKIQIQLNSNNESDDKNHLKMKITLELKEDYPNIIEIEINQNLIQSIDKNKFEKLVSAKAEESLGMPMLYDVCEHLREQLANMNEKILDKLQEIADSTSVEKALKSMAFENSNMTFTPVTKETFSKWLDEYNEKRRKMKEEMKSDLDMKPTGRELFTMKNKLIDEIIIDEEDAEEFEENKDDEEEEEDFQYDQALYVRDEQEDEEVDFD